MKKILLTVIFAITLIGGVNISEAGGPKQFSDINCYNGTPDELDNYCDAINTLTEKGIVKGFKDGTFRPKNFITRAEFTKIIIEIKYNSIDPKCLNTKLISSNEVIRKKCELPLKRYRKFNNFIETTQKFPDVRNEEWFFSYINFANQEGIINGRNDGKFYPNENINYAEASKILVNTFIEQTAPSSSDNWWKPFAKKLSENYFIEFPGNHLVTRGEMSDFVYGLEFSQNKTDSSFYSSPISKLEKINLNSNNSLVSKNLNSDNKLIINGFEEASINEKGNLDIEALKITLSDFSNLHWGGWDGFDLLSSVFYYKELAIINYKKNKIIYKCDGPLEKGNLYSQCKTNNRDYLEQFELGEDFSTKYRGDCGPEPITWRKIYIKKIGKSNIVLEAKIFDKEYRIKGCSGLSDLQKQGIIEIAKKDLEKELKTKSFQNKIKQADNDAKEFFENVEEIK